MFYALVLAFIAAAHATPVTVRFVGESLCPYCRKFVGTALNSSLEDPSIFDIIDFDYYPWGNAYYNIAGCGGVPGVYNSTARLCWGSRCGKHPTEDCFTGPITWQHGPGEGYGNIVENCAKTLIPGEPLKFMRFVHCFEYEGNATEADLYRCAPLYEMPVARVLACSKDPSSYEQLLQMAAVDTLRIAPTHESVPWVVVNGYGIPAPEELTPVICSAYSGPKPAACAQ